MNKVFISHSSKDSEVVQKIVKVLQSFQIEYWVDFEQLEIGGNIIETINKNLENTSYFMLIWSKNANDSNVVRNEMEAFLSSYVSSKTPLIILKIDETDLPPLFSGTLYNKISKNVNEEDIIKIISIIKNNYLKNSERVKEENQNQSRNHSKKEIKQDKLSREEQLATTIAKALSIESQNQNKTNQKKWIVERIIQIGGIIGAAIVALLIAGIL
jgi:hypothetical protein